MTDRERIYADITAERESQDARWGNQTHSMPVWNAILAEECGEVAQAGLTVTFHGDTAEHLAHLREELIQVAAVAVHIIEKIDSGDWVRGV
ncbi:MAG: hypothetical protein M9953_00955 [Thermomicrobiales bacterium]|nr:hypothetical protein [Thermomicrobiales bacterium]MCO5217859.1 hypothetical protein [Thermomicrobiales bacterium]MCO5223886.1 hypothetical protein [Thermomicrobiales bacterium]MCO5227450.1 hypothetical protein [Thermomicrobiales bacterium]